MTEQINVTENVSLTAGTHQFKFGVDYRRLHSTAAFQAATWTYGFYFSRECSHEYRASRRGQRLHAEHAVGDPELELVCSGYMEAGPKADNHVRRAMGVQQRSFFSPNHDTLPFTVIGVDNLRTMTLAPQGTPLWDATKRNFAPRLGVAWLAAPNLVIRAGGGILYDLGYSSVASGISTWPYQQQKVILNTSFPMSPRISRHLRFPPLSRQRTWS